MLPALLSRRRRVKCALLAGASAASGDPLLRPRSHLRLCLRSWSQVWQPFNNKFFETLSYLPPLTPDAIARQVDYLTRNGMIPCIEFASAQEAIVSNANTGETRSG